MKVDLKERTAAAPREQGIGESKHSGGRWALIAISLAVAAMAIGTLATLHGQTSSPGSHTVYLDPMTGVREGGQYSTSGAGTWVNPMTGVREGGQYSTSGAGTWVNPMTGAREGGQYSTPAP